MASPFTVTGLERLINDKTLQNKISGNIGILCHAASITSKYNHSLIELITIYKDRIKKVFGPQHGFVTDVQDNMVESDHYVHPYFNLKVYSLYSETRIPTKDMLEGIDSIIIDLQDVGTRIYTYIYTMMYMMQVCGELGIKVYILDRPNPINGKTIEGNILDPKFKSFVGLQPLPVRHGMTIGEIAHWFHKFCHIKCDYEVIEMKNWNRSFYFEQTGLPYVNPSPNLPTLEGCLNFPGSVLLEGTNLSEGRGTTRPLEVIGHPKIGPFALEREINEFLNKPEINPQSFKLRPIYFHPMFQKHGNTTCGGFFIHILDKSKFSPWRTYQLLIQFMHRNLTEFEWKEPPYEYEYDKNPMDLINGSDQVRSWIESNGSVEELITIEKKGMKEFLDQREAVLLYS